jgi:hypothetical protein
VLDLGTIGVDYEWIDKDKKLVKETERLKKMHKFLEEERAERLAKWDAKVHATPYVMELFDDLCVAEHVLTYTDAEFADMISKICRLIPSDLEVNHVGVNRIIERRVKKYCERNGIDMKDYNGVLPYRKFIV